MKIDINKLQEFTRDSIKYCLHNCQPESYAGYLKYCLENYLDWQYQVQVEWTSSVRINIQNGSTELEFTLPIHSS